MRAASNDRYAAGADVFSPPDALLTRAPTLLGTDGTKMSKSRRNTIDLRATEDQTAQLLRRAKTDAERHITYEPQRRPEVANLLLMAALCTGADPAELADSLGDRGAAALKALATEAVNEHLRPLRRRRSELSFDLGHLGDVLRTGNTRANRAAEATLDQVRQVMDMRY